MSAYCLIHLTREHQKPGDQCDRIMATLVNCTRCPWKRRIPFGILVPDVCPKCNGNLGTSYELCGRELLDVQDD